MKTALFFLLPVVVLLGVMPAALADARQLSDTQRYNDGYSNGSDAAATDRQNGNPFDSTCDPTSRYTSGGGHTTTYCNGWTDGYTSTYNSGGPTTTVPPSSSGPNYIDICNKIQFALVSSCGALVNPDNTLTVDGKRVNDCISGGAVLSEALF
jgi:hypothetical protein